MQAQPQRANFLAFLKKAVKPHRDKRDPRGAGQPVHAHHAGGAWHGWRATRTCSFHFTPVGSSWINQIETWFGIITRQSIRRGTFTSVTVLIKQIRDYIDHWNADPKPFDVDGHRRRDPGQGPTRANQHQETRRQQRQVKTTGSRDTSCGSWRGERKASPPPDRSPARP